MRLTIEKLASFFLTLLLFVALSSRFVGLDLDPPIVSWSAAFLTDEGWWMKNAMTFVRFGDLVVHPDYNLFPVAPTFNLFGIGVFALFGVDLIMLRAAVALLGVWAVFEFYRACKISFPPLVAAATALLCGLSINLFAYGRFVLLDPFACALALAGVCLWIRKPGSLNATWLSLILALLAFTVKISYLFVVALLMFLWGVETILQYRKNRDRKEFLQRFAPIALAAVVVCTFRPVFRALYPDTFELWDFTGAQHHFKLLEQGNLETILSNVAGTFPRLPENTNSGILVMGALFGIGVYLLSLSVPRFRALPSRGMIAFSLWVLGGCLVYGITSYQPPRNYVFAVFGLAFLSIEGLSIALKRNRLVFFVGVVAFVCWYGSSQYPLYKKWLDKSNNRTMMNAAQEVCQITRRDFGKEGTINIVGDQAHFLALVCDDIRPIGLQRYMGKRALCDRMEAWKPEYAYYLSRFHKDFRKLRSCETPASSVRNMKTYSLVPGYARHAGRGILVKMSYE